MDPILVRGPRRDNDIGNARKVILRLGSREGLAHASPELGQYIDFEPGIGDEPGDVAWRGMWQRNDVRQVSAPGLHRLGQGRVCRGAEEVQLCVATDQKGERYRGHVLEDPVVPERRAFAPGRPVTACSATGIAIGHREDRDAGCVVERFRIDPHPVAQAFAAAVVPGNPARVHPRARSLADDENPGSDPGLKDGTRAERQVRLAHATGANLFQKAVETAADPAVHEVDDARSHGESGREAGALRPAITSAM